MSYTQRLLKTGLVVLVTAGIVGCESKAGTGAIVGGAGGAGVGAIVGNNSKGRTAEGALIGGALGAIGGGLIGHGIDEKDRKEALGRDASTITREDVIDWTHEGVRDDMIIDRIDRSGTVFRMTAADQNELRDNGVSESVIRAMRDTSRR